MFRACVRALYLWNEYDVDYYDGRPMSPATWLFLNYSWREVPATTSPAKRIGGGARILMGTRLTSVYSSICFLRQAWNESFFPADIFVACVSVSFQRQGE